MHAHHAPVHASDQDNIAVERVQNIPLWQRFSLEKEHMLSRNGPQMLNQLTLFHGTKTADPYTLASSNEEVDFRLCATYRKLFWGRGAYFVSIRTHLTMGGLMQILIVSVLCGRVNDSSFNLNPELTRLPMNYDSVMGSSINGQIHIVYDLSKASCIRVHLHLVSVVLACDLLSFSHNNYSYISFFCVCVDMRLLISHHHLYIPVPSHPPP